MNDLTKLVFDALGVDKDEEFLIKEDCTKSIYQISGILVVYMREPKSEFWQVSPVDIRLLLTGARTIVKIPHPTERDREILRACKALCTYWVARDKSELAFAYANKPRKFAAAWGDEKRGTKLCLSCVEPHNLTWIRWEDDEPVNLEAIV